MFYLHSSWLSRWFLWLRCLWGPAGPHRPPISSVFKKDREAVRPRLKLSIIAGRSKSSEASLLRLKTRVWQEVGLRVRLLGPGFRSSHTITPNAFFSLTLIIPSELFLFLILKVCRNDLKGKEAEVWQHWAKSQLRPVSCFYLMSKYLACFSHVTANSCCQKLFQKFIKTWQIQQTIQITSIHWLENSKREASESKRKI